MTKVYRQGDVNLFLNNHPERVPLSSLKSLLNTLNTNVLAYGEKTGHKHQFLGGKVSFLEDSTSKRRFLDVTETTVLVHDEHGLIELEPNFYEVVIQREYVPGGWRNIQD
jgi:hypothetical protein